MYGINQTQIPFYGGVPMMRARGGQTQANCRLYASSATPMLQSHGYYHGAIDGISGPQTQAAYAAFQRASGGVPVQHAPPPITASSSARLYRECLCRPSRRPWSKRNGCDGYRGDARAFGSPSGGITTHVDPMAYPNTWDGPKQDPSLTTSWPPKPGQMVPTFSGKMMPWAGGSAELGRAHRRRRPHVGRCRRPGAWLQSLDLCLPGHARSPVAGRSPAAIPGFAARRPAQISIARDSARPPIR
jgi:hypothetical protein